METIPATSMQAMLANYCAKPTGLHQLRCRLKGLKDVPLQDKVHDTTSSRQDSLKCKNP